MNPPAIGRIVDVPWLHPESPHRDNPEDWPDGQRGRVVELAVPEGWEDPQDPLVCLEIERPDGPRFAWFRAGDIRAGRIDGPEFSLSADAMLSRHRPRRLGGGPDPGPRDWNPRRDYRRYPDRWIEYFCPDTDDWWIAARYDGPTEP